MLYDSRFSGFKRNNPHLEGTHAFLSPSGHHWLRYTDEKLVERLNTAQAAARGTRIHAWAAEAIALGFRQPENEDSDALCAYINDAIDYRMKPEQTLFYSMNCYGTADAIGFDFENLFLRIHDLKTGTSKVPMDQLYVYAAIFCLEYTFKPFEISGELRIYQGDKIICEAIDNSYLAWVYDRIQISDEIIEQHRRENGE